MDLAASPHLPKVILAHHMVRKEMMLMIVEMDSAEAASMLKMHSEDQSQYRVHVGEIRRVAVAEYGRCTPRTAVWLCSGLDSIVNLSKADMLP